MRLAFWDGIQQHMTYHNAEQVARLRVGIAPRGVMPIAIPANDGPAIDLVAVTEQDRIQIRVRLDTYAVEYCHIIRSIGVVRDTSESWVNGGSNGRMR